MNIIYLNQLQNHPTLEINNSGYFSTIQGISMSEIEQLEQTWNNGNPFSTALRELLFLAGNDCYVLDTGLMQNQQQMQEKARSWMLYEGQERTITRPFYVIEVMDTEQFTLVYLDEGDNPIVHYAFLPHGYENALGDGVNWLSSSDISLKDFINDRISDVKKGYNPF